MAAKQQVKITQLAPSKACSVSPEQWEAIKELRFHVREVVRLYAELDPFVDASQMALDREAFKLVDAGNYIDEYFENQYLPRLEALQEA